MKKLIYLFAINLLIFSCSENELSDSSKNTDDVLVNKIVAIWDNGTVEVIDFVYEGNKLIRIEELNNRLTTFTYDTNGLLKGITKDVNTGGYINTSFTYNEANELISYTDFYHNTDNNIESEDQAIKFEIQDLNSTDKVLKIFNGNHDSQTHFVKDELVYYNNGNRIRENDNINYFYDNKNGLFKNIHAFKTLQLLNEAALSGIHINASRNNISNIKSSGEDGHITEAYDYSYNDDNYPIKAHYKINGEIKATIEYFLSKE